MKQINLNRYSPIISDKIIGDLIYGQINELVAKNEKVEIDLSTIISMATFCAKQIFGQLYLTYGPAKFFELIIIKNATDDLKAIIRIGIESAIEDDTNK